MTRWLPIGFVFIAGCFHAPDIVVIDRSTALERAAQGSYPQLEEELERAATQAVPAPLTREQLEQTGHPRPILDEETASDAERVDALLKERCVGEALDGTLMETRDRCAIKEVPHLSALVERTNRDRAQIWEWLRSLEPKRSLADVRRAWREVHLRGVPCGGQVQQVGGSWEPKKC
jgi:hypothetical protein